MLAEALHDDAAEESRASAGSLARESARAVGSAVHRVLEHVALQGGTSVDEALAGQLADLDRHVAPFAEPADRDAVAGDARRLLESLRGGRCLARLETIRAHVLARELPVLLPAPDEAGLADAAADALHDRGRDPDTGPAAPTGFVSGAIDLVYRDPDTGEVVVADHKTEPVADDADAARRAGLHRAQLHAYVRAVQDALGLAERPRAELWFLAADRIEPVPGG